MLSETPFPAVFANGRITRIHQAEMPIEHSRCLHLLSEMSIRLPKEEDPLSLEARLAANLKIIERAQAGEGGEI